MICQHGREHAGEIHSGGKTSCMCCKADNLLLRLLIQLGGEHGELGHVGLCEGEREWAGS